MKHRATGRPRGRPPSVPVDLGTQIYDALKRKMDPDTRMVRPQWKKLARELGVSRSTSSRKMPYLKAAGLIESVVLKYDFVSEEPYDFLRMNESD